MTNCPFCRIAAEPSLGAILLESSLSIAFLDIRPIRPGHALIVPRRHDPDYWRLTPEEQQDIMALASRLEQAQRALYEPPKVGLLIAGFDVAHAHVHVLPLYTVRDVTAESILNGTAAMASPDELAAQRQRYAPLLAG